MYSSLYIKCEIKDVNEAIVKIESLDNNFKENENWQRLKSYESKLYNDLKFAIAKEKFDERAKEVENCNE